MSYRLLFSFLLSLAVVACGGSSSGTSDSETDAGGDTAGGDTGGDTAGTATAGNTDGDMGNDTSGDTGNNTGGDSSGDTISGNVQFLGFVSIDEDVSANEVNATGSFIRYTSAIAGNLFEPVYTPQLDSCTVQTIDASNSNTDFPDINANVVPEIVSAGEVIPLTSSAGSYIQLSRESVFGFLFYSPEPDTVPGPIPSQLTLDIPGDVFPAFANVNMPVVQPLITSSPTQGQPITPTTSFTWTAGSNSDAYIAISATTIDATGASTVVECEATDDGEFSFPAQTQTEMGASFTSTIADYVREVSTFQQQGNALLVLTATSGD